jgi:hypothetical protein
MDTEGTNPFYRKNLTSIDLTEAPLFIDVAYESDDSRVFDLTMLLYEELKDFSKPVKRADAVQNRQKHLRGALIALLLKAQSDPSKPIISLRDNNFGKHSYAGEFVLYNPLRYDMRKMRDCFDALEVAGYLEIFKGDSTTLLSVFERKGFETIKLKRKIVGKGLIVKVTEEPADKKNTVKKKKYYIYDYSDISLPDHMTGSSEFLHSYNALLQKTLITLPEDKGIDKVDTTRKTVWRTFGNEAYTHGGRFVGGWWANCKKDLRRIILINGEKTVEVDYTAKHLLLFHAMKGEGIPKQCRSDPYAISDEFDRDAIKMIITRLVNSSGRRGINKALELDFLHNGEIKGALGEYSNIKKVLDIIYNVYPVLKEIKHKDIGKEIMFEESQIAQTVMKTFVDQDIPILCIHDSFIVPVSFEDMLKTAMVEAYKDHGYSLTPIVEKKR